MDSWLYKVSGITAYGALHGGKLDFGFSHTIITFALPKCIGIKI